MQCEFSILHRLLSILHRAVLGRAAVGSYSLGWYSGLRELLRYAVATVLTTILLAGEMKLYCQNEILFYGLFFSNWSGAAGSRLSQAGWSQYTHRSQLVLVDLHCGVAIHIWRVRSGAAVHSPPRPRVRSEGAV